LQAPLGLRKKVLASRNRKNTNMAPGGMSKRVTASSDVEPPATRSSKRLQTQERAGQNDEETGAPNSTAAHDTAQTDSGNGHDSSAALEVSSAGGTDSRGADEDNVAEAELGKGKL
jgi:hypothetical protein